MIAAWRKRKRALGCSFKHWSGVAELVNGLPIQSFNGQPKATWYSFSRRLWLPVKRSLLNVVKSTGPQEFRPRRNCQIPRRLPILASSWKTANYATRRCYAKPANNLQPARSDEFKNHREFWPSRNCRKSSMDSRLSGLATRRASFLVGRIEPGGRNS